MANSKRRAEYTDRNGNMLIPINVEGGTWNEHFITTPKLLCIVGIILSLFFIIVTLDSENSRWTQYAIWLGIWGLISIQIMRFIVFEEKFYYRMYKELQQHEISSPAIFWDIASIKDTDEGAILTYSDARIAIIVKLERDTITGKNKDFKEMHYDAISDFYKEVATNKYSFVQMNIMEQAGKDPRLNELSKIVNKSDNDNICKLMEMQVGHIKNITHTALYESDYFLFYTVDMSKIDIIIQDIAECMFKLLDGAYVSYQVLSSKEIVDLVKEIYGVNYFNATEASLLMFDNTAGASITPFTISSLVWTDSYKQDLTNAERNKLRNLTSSVIRETISVKNLALKDTLYRKDEKNKIGIDFTDLSNIHNIQNKGGLAQQGQRTNQRTNSQINKNQQQQVRQQPQQNRNQTVQIQQQQVNNQARQTQQQNIQYQQKQNQQNNNISNEDDDFIDF